MMLQDRLNRQRAVDKMQLAKVEREKQQEMEQVRDVYVGAGRGSFFLLWLHFLPHLLGFLFVFDA